MGQKRIANVEIGVTWTSVVGALAGVLRALGEPCAISHLMGLTGHAFRLALTQADGVLAAGPAAPAADFARALPLYANAGRRWALVSAATTDRDFAARRRETLTQIRRSIDRGRPVIAYDIHLPEFGIIHGYDDTARTLVVSSMLSRQYGATLAASRWPVPERAGRFLVLLPGARTKPEPRRTLRESLRFAVAYADYGDPGDPAGATHGLAALTRWRDALHAGEPLDPAGNARLIQTVQSARRDAARYLRDSAAGLPSLSGSLSAAAAAYDRVALAYSRMATLFPYPGGGSIGDVGTRTVAAFSLRDAEVHERAALHQLRQVLTGLE